MHLVFLIHGLLGNPSHLHSMKESIRSAMGEQYKRELIVYRARAMSAVATLDGVEQNARRLLIELLAKIDELRPSHISIVGYSMGGLCARYLIGLLQDAHTFDTVHPVLFATFATPHLGSMYVKDGAFGRVFNFVGAHVVGTSGPDLFGTSTLLTDLADPHSSFYKGLERFQYLYLFANAFGDRTVNFWTAYIAPKNPFERRSRLDLHTYEAVPIVVDMGRSRCVDTAVKVPARSLGDRAARAAVNAVMPVALIFVVSVMGTLSVVALTRQKFGGNDTARTLRRVLDPNYRADAVAGGFGSALDETLDYAESRSGELSASKLPEEETAGLPKPSLNGGLDGAIDSAPQTLSLSSETLAQLDALNKLPWRKYAVAFSRIHTHGTIVDRKQDSADGKRLMDFFADRLVECHRDQHKLPSKL